jgi:hypothetical protein
MARIAQSLLLTRRSIAAAACTAVAAVAVGVAAGQGGGASDAVPAARAPACAHASKPIGRPSEVPAALLPPRTVLTGARRQHGLTFVSGVVALTFQEAVRFYFTALPAAGYLNGLGDAEMDEAESFFTGSALHGKWKVNGIASCPNAVVLTLYVKE